MTRRASLSLAAMMAACGKKAVLPSDLFPLTAAGVWSRSEFRDLPIDEAPDPVPRNAVERIQTAAYKGPGELQARVYLLNSAEVGAALGTRWRPSADTVFFNHGQFFVVIKWQSADRKALQEFVAQLQKKLGAAARRKDE